MTLEIAIRATEILLAFAFLVQSAEHVVSLNKERSIFLVRAGLSVILMAGLFTPYICLGLVINTLFILHRFQGPYNGGSDRMGVLILCCLTLVHVLPQDAWKEYAFGYLALQVILSYFIAGWVKVMNPEWRSGRALQDVFLFSAYPVSEALRSLAQRPKLLFVAGWAVMVFEVLFPFTILSPIALIIGLGVAAIFHLANAFLFGLNRFFWVWLAAYPSLLWLQDRILS